MKWIRSAISNFLLQSLVVAITLIGTMAAAMAAAKSDAEIPSFSQIVLPFAKETEFQHDWSNTENSLHLHFPHTTVAELEPIYNYDENLVRRVVIKDLGSRGTDVTVVLKNKNVRGNVYSFKEPHRIVIELYDNHYRETKDPITGLPSSAADIADASESPKIASSTATAKETVKRRLIQTLPDDVSSPNELKNMLSKINPGTGKAWTSFPPYIYRVQLASINASKTENKDLSALQNKALSTSDAMADYAEKLFDFGHEARALAAYQLLLQRDPGVLEHSPAHLWKFAEAHLGQGNLTLAEGYYQTLLDKHPEDPLAGFARLRKLDVQAFRAISSESKEKLAQINEKAQSITTRNNPDLMAMLSIRNAWWTDESIDQTSRLALPTCDEETDAMLNKLVSRVENPKTAYLASALITKRITNKKTDWQKNYAEWLGKFFNRYKGSPDATAQEQLSADAKERLTNEFAARFNQNQFTDVVALYEQLPKEMKSIAKSPTVSWQIAESYRTLGQADESLPFYSTAAKSLAPMEKFKAHFWITSTASSRATALKGSHGKPARIRALEADAKNSDAIMNTLWSKLSPDEKSVIMTGLSSPLQEIIASDAKLKTPARIILEQYKTLLSVNPPKMNATPGTGKTEWVGNFSPSGATVKLLDDLGRKFADLGMPKERREAMQLMKFLKPSQFEQDKEAAKIWASELTKLAEDHRKADEFLEAGELYTLIGDAAPLAEGRAESLYKGGLLLFRAGKKQEAMQALEKAKNDTSNLFYSKLATERLNQMDAH